MPKIKKYLPIILLLVGILVVVGAFLFVRNRNKEPEVEEEETSLIEVDLKDRPIASLIPTENGHYLNLKVEKIQIPGAESMDYELIYKTGSGLTQGVPGMFKINGQDTFETELLMGSESSGKFRYDEGVEDGTLTLRFRNEKGKLLIKFETDFHLQTQTQEMTSLDGFFKYTRSLKNMNNDYWIIMETFGTPKDPGGDVIRGPYGVFSSSTQAEPGSVEFDMNVGYFRFDENEWVDVRNTPSDDIGIFVAVGE